MTTVKETRQRLASADERWYALAQAEVPGRLGVVLDSGLSADEAAKRLRLTQEEWLEKKTSNEVLSQCYI